MVVEAVHVIFGKKAATNTALISDDKDIQPGLGEQPQCFRCAPYPAEIDQFMGILHIDVQCVVPIEKYRWLFFHLVSV
jgi:hypothetical protein